MSEYSQTECLFVGGTADGKRFHVGNPSMEYHHSSLANAPEDSHAAQDGDPRPEKHRVVEVYRPITVKAPHDEETVFVLNALGEAAIQAQLVKHFGRDVTFSK